MQGSKQPSFLEVINNFEGNVKGVYKMRERMENIFKLNFHSYSAIIKGQIDFVELKAEYTSEMEASINNKQNEIDALLTEYVHIVQELLDNMDNVFRNTAPISCETIDSTNYFNREWSKWLNGARDTVEDVEKKLNAIEKQQDLLQFILDEELIRFDKATEECEEALTDAITEFFKNKAKKWNTFT